MQEQTIKELMEFLNFVVWELNTDTIIETRQQAKELLEKYSKGLADDTHK
jgi:hypothetical protein